MNTRRFLLSLLCIILCLSLHAQKKPPKTLYVPMDYSTCGYHASEAPIPDVRAVVKVERQSGDCSSLIQRAIDQVAALPADAKGHRGAILLGEGTFQIDEPLRIHTSGIVLRGMGVSRTRLVKHGADRGAAIYIEGTAIASEGTDTFHITGPKTQAGSTTLTLSHTKGLKVGDRIRITRPCTREWIVHLAMNDFGGGLDYTGWKPGDTDITWDRTIVDVNGKDLTIDAPITTTISSEFGSAFVIAHHPNGELSECGIENMTIDTETHEWNPLDEDHCWDGVAIERARDVWVRRVDFKHLAGSAVILHLHTSRITVEDCISTDPVSEVGGWRRCVFTTRGQQTLFQRCLSRKGIHDFSAGACAAGPNAFVQCDGEEALGFSGSIGSWAAGLLFDIVNIDGNDLRIENLGQFQMGTGWNSANAMLWQCTASTITCFSPDADNRSSGHGCWGTLTGNGEWTSSNDHVSPRSLFYDQLQRRLATRLSSDSATRLATTLGRLLPISTSATSSPTSEEAMALAQASLTTSRLTLEEWIAQSPPLSPTLFALHPQKAIRRKNSPRPSPPSLPTYAGTSHITADGRLITGTPYAIPWWNGRVKDNVVAREGRPAVTRFVPGREGTGWTDRLDSVAQYLSSHHYGSLDHHYGLWYDLRRIDHERVRRADGDVAAPFYEQPFARSGKGTSWDGLSRYDLTRPNLWYWKRLNDFARLTEPLGILLFHEHYFQHNILEAGAHWVDCPWRPVNNINGTDFPEPVPFAGDKRIFMAEQFYDERSEVLAPLHRQYIRMCLEQMRTRPNVVHLLSAEYTGPVHFTRFWLQTIAEWEEETGEHPIIALSCTRDAQDSIMADPRLAKVVDVIDIRYWHYNTEGLWAPSAGGNLAPRQWMRKMKVGKTGFDEVYRAVRECHDRYPGKAIIYNAQQYDSYGWAVLLAGGSLPALPFGWATASDLQRQWLTDATHMQPINSDDAWCLGDSQRGYLILPKKRTATINVAKGTYTLYRIEQKTGETTIEARKINVNGTFTTPDSGHSIFWLRR